MNFDITAAQNTPANIWTVSEGRGGVPLSASTTCHS